ncbi:hypothetical protein LOTGIDRAFT_231392 [Lottia gigantea]|uniref:NF-kappa-B essential modulator NEMO CC2-LZ domain-containing protein n=1 Tax=Lottia gigantea TaxID=225164 RepID=V4A377_LOTGI|nr:hypothetical protein LOTGIDRAFT_231392 [Lottia gigantea]ESO98318.1 hypothetical protein LOTGIDRAFT_231392 [Lottia gigantea]
MNEIRIKGTMETLAQKQFTRTPSSEESIENSMLKEKIENLKLVIKQSNQQLDSERIKIKGVETVTKLLQETRDELQTTQKQKRALEAAVKNLQSRLTINSLPDDVTLQENDVYVASLCPQTLENLSRENVRLKNLLHQCGNGVEVKDLNKFQDTIDDLNKRITNLTVENDHLQNQLRNAQDSNNKYGYENQSYGDQIAIENHQELENFQTILRSFASQCQDLDSKLNKVKEESNVRRSSSSSSISNDRSSFQHVTSEELEILKKNNLQLESKVTEITSMNVRWQEYTKQLVRTIQEQKTEILNHQSILQERTAEINSLRTKFPSGIESTLNEAYDQCQQIQQEKAIAEQEASQFKSLYQELNHSVEEKQARIQELQERVRNLSSGPNIGEDSAETITVLMAQIQICAEDFEKERKDRARAQSELTDVRAQLEKSKKEADRYRVMYQTKINQPRDLYQPTAFIPAVQSNVEAQLASRGHREREELVIDGPGSLNLKDYEILDPSSKDVYQSLPVPVPDKRSFLKSKSVPGRKQSTERANEVLCCPKCSKDFAEGQKLLDHIETCVE